MTHGEVVHSQARSIVIGGAELFAGASRKLSVLILTPLHAALASSEAELRGVNRKTTTLLLSLASFAELAFIFSQ